VPITVRLEHYDAERFRELCRDAGCSQADWIARAINEAPNAKDLARRALDSE
jgi:hypothetical protein